MYTNFFFDLKKFGIPVSIQEYLTFLECLQNNLSEFEIEKFYFLAKTSLVKHEKYFDTFDQIFSSNFNGLEKIDLEKFLDKTKLIYRSIIKDYFICRDGFLNNSEFLLAKNQDKPIIQPARRLHKQKPINYYTKLIKDKIKEGYLVFLFSDGYTRIAVQFKQKSKCNYKISQ